MERKYLIGLMAIVLTLFSTSAAAQMSLGGGVSSFHGLNLPIHRIGFNAFIEVPRAANNTFMVRASYMLPHKEFDGITQVNGKDGIYPSITNASINSKTTYFAVDGGTRFYFFNDYDIGTSMYANGFIKGIVSSYKAVYSLADSLNINDYVTTDYPPKELNTDKALYSVFFSFGGSVGVKHQLPRGALMFDAGIEFISPLMDPSQILRNEISPLSFSLHLAYRFDWF